LSKKQALRDIQTNMQKRKNQKSGNKEKPFRRYIPRTRESIQNKKKTYNNTNNGDYNSDYSTCCRTKKQMTSASPLESLKYIARFFDNSFS